ncbi:hypothetical protein JCM5350_001432 [Sporobolomyces pararoseus]
MASPSSLGLSEKRLYIGNLSTSVDEYSLMQICSKYGKISKLDYLFHKSGPQKGKPRGYAFIDYSTKEESLKAMNTLHDKVLRGRKLIVSLASEQDSKDSSALAGGGGNKKRKSVAQSEVNRPTTISLLKGQGVAHVPTNRKIAALEAKLALMKGNKKDSAVSPSPSGSGSSTPKPTSSTTAADEFLNDLLPNPTSESQASSTGTTTTTTKTKNKEIDISKAGLPARPYFESNQPPREM